MQKVPENQRWFGTKRRVPYSPKWTVLICWFKCGFLRSTGVENRAFLGVSELL